MDIGKTALGIFITLGSLTIGSEFAKAEPAAEPSPALTAAADPFAFADFTWSPGNYAPPESVLAMKYFTPEIRFDAAYHYEFSHPQDNTIGGSSEAFRSRELQITDLGFGGDFNYNHVGFRLMTQFGLYSTATPRNDASTARGQWDLGTAYRYLSEAYGSYHLDVMNGINVQAGLFLSYIGLWSFYNFDNWTYQPSFLPAATPWYLSGARVQIFTSDKLKIEPWIVNGWQSYGSFAHQPGVGLQVLWKPVGWFTGVTNEYYGADDLGLPERRRFHTDTNVMAKYYEKDGGGLSQAAASFTLDAGCDTGPSAFGAPAATCGNNSVLGFMAYNRFWFDRNHYALTLGGGAINNPGRYLGLLPPINGATAASPPDARYFTTNPGDPFWAWDTQITGDYMPTRNLTFRLEYTHRWASVPYFAGSGGLTPPGGNTGNPGSYVSGWAPDLVQTEDRLTAAMLVRL